jgi:SAM-dependent methyltransferase
LSDAQRSNVHDETVLGFGDEWRRFDQRALSAEEKRDLFEKYFGIFPFCDESSTWEGFDAGCGSGRWATLIAPRVRKLHVIDASAEALDVAKRNLRDCLNCEFHHRPLDAAPLADGSMDFGYSLGVLHHIPDTPAALASCVRKLKAGAPFLVYLYYAFDNRPRWFQALWRLSDRFRRVISVLPHGPRYVVCSVLAAVVYWPLATVARLGRSIGRDIGHWPLSFYADRSFYVMRTDALDRFGTRLEQRFSRDQIEAMMHAAGLDRVQFSTTAPFWCAIGYRSLAQINDRT